MIKAETYHAGPLAPRPSLAGTIADLFSQRFYRRLQFAQTLTG